MEKISKVKTVFANGTFKSQYGVDLGNGEKGFFKFDYEFEDGTSLAANHKENPAPFKVGDTVEYKVKGSNDYGSYGTVGKPQEQPQQQSYSGGQKSNQNASFALSYAKDWCLGLHHAGDTKTANDVLDTANIFKDWLDKN